VKGFHGFIDMLRLFNELGKRNDAFTEKFGDRGSSTDDAHHCRGVHVCAICLKGRKINELLQALRLRLEAEYDDLSVQGRGVSRK
jgi:hypothetical protein